MQGAICVMACIRIAGRCRPPARSCVSVTTADPCDGCDIELITFLLLVSDANLHARLDGGLGIYYNGWPAPSIIRSDAGCCQHFQHLGLCYNEPPPPGRRQALGPMPYRCRSG